MTGENQASGRSAKNLSSRDRPPSAVEWLVGAIASLLVLGGIGILFYDEWGSPSLSPFLAVRPTRIVAQPEGGYVVEFVAANGGSVTARGLTIEGRLLELEGGEEVGKSTATLTWVPPRAERNGGLFFSHDPRRYRLEIKPGGYERP